MSLEEEKEGAHEHWNHALEIMQKVLMPLLPTETSKTTAKEIKAKYREVFKKPMPKDVLEELHSIGGILRYKKTAYLEWNPDTWFIGTR